ncbi:hypothetical protein LRP50_24835, partial [Enterovibrio sp. ZSDZ42]|nr:hypothetical protein [Enterovibrio sp. ZSDZ42]
MKKRPQYAWWQTIYAQPIANWWNDLREGVDVKPLDDPMEPVMSVTDEILTVRNASHNALFAFMLPMMLASWFMAFTGYDMFWPDLKAIEQSANESISNKMAIFGNDFFEITEEPVALNIYSRVGEDGKTSWGEYINYRRSQYGGGLGKFTFEMALILAPLLAALYLTYRV